MQYKINKETDPQKKEKLEQQQSQLLKATYDKDQNLHKPENMTANLYDASKKDKSFGSFLKNSESEADKIKEKDKDGWQKADGTLQDKKNTLWKSDEFKKDISDYAESQKERTQQAVKNSESLDTEKDVKKDENGNVLKHEEVEDKDGKKIKVVTHTGPRGGKFYYPKDSPKDAEHRVYVESLYEYTKNNMKSIEIYINENTEVDEGLLRDIISLAPLAKMSSEDLLNGVLSMYDYICDEDDIDLFYQDMPLGEVPLWKNLYKLYQNKAWSILDVNKYSVKKSVGYNRNKAEDDDDSDENLAEALDLEPNVFVRITPEFRRSVRQIIQNSRNSKLDLKAGQIESVMLIQDEKLDKEYIITINRVSGFFKRMFRFADKRFLIKAFEKMGKEIDNGRI